ncbi:MAG: ABC transporter permease, partial [Spirochaetales bacterium]|nr:ABC transporter permease [Spirochaetales bacterium]
VAVYGEVNESIALLELHGITVSEYTDREAAINRVRNHQIDFLIDPAERTYYLNETSPRGKLVEELFVHHGGEEFRRLQIEGEPIRYIDWFVPGVIGTNMMFSSLFGVGFVIVRYRKNGVLKRLKATPLKPFEFVTAQVVSRLFIVTATSIIVFVGADLFLHFVMRGSYLDLILVMMLGITCLISFGLVFAARFRSEEVASGIMNVALWPMLAFSGVFFSLEAVPPALRGIARIFPLTHFLDGTRSIMLEGAGLLDIAPNILALAGMTGLFLLVASWLFVWE